MIQGWKLKLLLSTGSPFLGKVASHQHTLGKQNNMEPHLGDYTWTTWDSDYPTNIFCLEILKKNNQDNFHQRPKLKTAATNHRWPWTRGRKLCLTRPSQKPKHNGHLPPAVFFVEFSQSTSTWMWYRYDCYETYKPPQLGSIFEAGQLTFSFLSNQTRHRRDLTSTIPALCLVHRLYKKSNVTYRERER